MATISVLLPVYNCEQYLSQCIASILEQTFSDFELILIDDGSTDTSLEIAKDYAMRDCRVKIFHQENQGLAFTRNTAIQKASAEWLTFVDSDDWLEKNYLEYLQTVQKQTETKMVACNHFIDFDHKSNLRFPLTSGIKYMSLFDAQRSILYHGEPDVSAWGKLYHKSLFQQVEYPVGKLFEDTAVIGKLLANGGGIGIGYVPKYHYRYLSASISKKTDKKHLWDFIDAVESCLRTISDHADFSAGKERRRMHAYLSTLRLNICDEAPNWDPILSYIRKHAWKVLWDKRAPMRDKIGILAALPGKSFFDLVWSVYLKIR